MRIWPVITSLLLLGPPAAATGQSVAVQASAGPTLTDRGYSVAGGLGWSPWSRVTLAVNAERTHLAFRTSSDARGVTSRFRGGTETLGSAELQLSLFPRTRVTPCVLAGYGQGVSRPTVNDAFPTPVRNDVRAVFFGGGLHVPLGSRLGLVADVRLMLGDEANELHAIAPLRVGLRWSF